MWRTLGTGHNYWYMYSLMLIPSIYLNTDPYASVNAYFLNGDSNRKSVNDDCILILTESYKARFQNI